MVARSQPMSLRWSTSSLLGFLCLTAGVAAGPRAQAAPGPTPEPLTAAAASSTEKLPELRKAGVTLVAQSEYIEDSNGESFVDPSLFASYRQAHLQVWAGEFTKGAEIGGFLRDARRSTYGAFYRFRDEFDHVVDLSTEQLAGGGFVAYGGLRFIRVLGESVEDRHLLQPSVGFDKYYGSYHFFSVRAVRDSREGGRYSFVIANRFALRDKFVTLGLVPRTDGDLGYFVQAKWRWVRAGFGRYDRFDFTAVDRTVFNLGFEFDF